MCKAIENTSAKNQRIAREYAEFAYRRGYVYRDIFAAYNKPSIAKIRAWDYCKRLCKEMNGHDLIICARNSMKFSACFKFESDGKNCYAYITKDYDRFCYA